MIDLREMVNGILTIIFISIAIGQFDKLHSFAREQAIASLRGWPAYHFFPKGYGVEFSDRHVYVENRKHTAY
jgi:hypothetical protein